jgi:hypothetical protein
MTRLRTGIAAAVLPLALLAACGDDDPTPAGGAEGPTTSSSAAADVDYPAEGVDLVEPPELKGVYAEALQVYVDFERGRRLAARDGAPNELLSFNATGAVADPIVAATKKLGDATYDGVVAVGFVSAKPRDTVLLLDVCLDGTGLEVPPGAPAALGAATRSPQQVQVTNLSGPWRVTKVTPRSGTC